MTNADRYEVVFTAAARRGMNRLPLPAAAALFEHLTGPVADNPHRLGKQLDAPLNDLWSVSTGRSTRSTNAW
ncbi:MAG: type II toxin-antitoxin system RelE family toxin [Pseudonocardiaceae bacterium]